MVFSFRLHASLLLLSFCVASASGISLPTLSSRSAILLDATSGEVLFEKEPDIEIPPASLTKLMTMHVVFLEAAAGRVSLDDEVPIPRSAWAINQSWGSSLMFLAPGQKVSLRELLLGLSVSSGNDAAVAVALHIAGSVPAFASLMNDAAQTMGLVKTRFVEPSGISEKNMTTAREFAEFCRAYLAAHPSAIADFHSVREFAYPKPENVSDAYRDRPGTIVQYNRNLLLGEIEGVDGLKTGYIIESGYNIALTAERAGTRLLAVLLGGPGSSSARGGRIRADDGGTLLSWGFENFRTVRAEIERLDPVRVWKGKEKFAELVPGGSLTFTVAAGRGANGFSYRIERREGVAAPIEAGEQLGSIHFSDESGPLKSIPLIASERMPVGSFFRRLADSVEYFIRRVFGAIGAKA